MDYHIGSPLRHGRRPQAYIIPSEAKKKKEFYEFFRVGDTSTGRHILYKFRRGIKKEIVLIFTVLDFWILDGGINGPRAR